MHIDAFSSQYDQVVEDGGPTVRVRLFDRGFDDKPEKKKVRRRENVALRNVRAMILTRGMPGFPTLACAWTENGHCAIRMSHVGTSLYGAMSKTPGVAAPPAAVCWIGFCVIGYLKSLHSVGLVHRSVSPHSIHIKQDGELLLAAFDSCVRIGAASKEPPFDPIFAPAGWITHNAAAARMDDLETLAYSLVFAATGAHGDRRGVDMDLADICKAAPPPVCALLAYCRSGDAFSDQTYETMQAFFAGPHSPADMRDAFLRWHSARSASSPE